MSVLRGITAGLVVALFAMLHVTISHAQPHSESTVTETTARPITRTSVQSSDPATDNLFFSAFANFVPLAIPNNGAVDSTMNVPCTPEPNEVCIGKVVDVNVYVHITHPFVSDLDISLVSPDGTSIDLTSDNGGNGVNFGVGCNSQNDATGFDDSAATSITTIVAGGAPYQAVYRPEQALSGLTGQTYKGAWKLRLADDTFSLSGSLQCWRLNFVYERPVSHNPGVFRPTDGHIFLRNQNSTGIADVDITFGIPGDRPVAGDWDGNGFASIGVYRNGTFYLRNTNSTGFADIVATLGLPTDLPVVGDWDGDGDDTIGVYRNGTFFLRNTNTTGAPDLVATLGVAGDTPIAGDWNGDGTETIGVYRPSNGLSFLRNTNTTGFADITIVFGSPGDLPVTGDWNADGIDTIGVYRNGQFLVRNTNSTGPHDLAFSLGLPGDLPITGDWNGFP